MRHYKGQMSLFDYFSQGARFEREGYTNAWDKAKPESDSIVDVIDHDGNRFKTAMYVNVFGTWVFDASKDRGYDICWWRVVRPFNEQDREKYHDKLFDKGTNHDSISYHSHSQAQILA